MENIHDFSNLQGFCRHYVKRNNVEKPLMIWFGGTPGVSNVSVDVFNEKYVGLISESIIKSNDDGHLETKDYAVAIFHRYIGQMDENYLTDILNTFKTTHKPVIVFVNIENRDKKPNWIDNEFEQVMFELI